MLWNGVAAAATGECSLADLPLRTDAWIHTLRMDAAAHEHDVLLRLLEIGFLPGESVRVIAKGVPGGDPLAVRVGHTTFALRRHEASMIRVQAMAGGAGSAR